MSPVDLTLSLFLRSAAPNGTKPEPLFGPNGIDAPVPANVETIKSAWFALMIIGGQIFLPIILLTMLLSKNVRRGPALLNAVVLPILMSLVSCMLLYSGHARGPEPPYALCLAQASFMYGIGPAVLLTPTILAWQVWSSLRAVTYGKELEEERTTRARTLLVVLPPYFVFLVFMVASLIHGSMHPEWVSRSRSVYYCSIQSRIDVGAAIVSSFFSLLALIFEVLTMVALHKKWDTSITKIVLPHTQLAFNVKLIKRIFAFTVLFSILNSTALLEGVNPAMVLVPRFNFAIWPVGLAIAYGTQPSILRVWCFWKPRKPRTEVDSYATTFSIVADGQGGIASVAGGPVRPKRSNTLLSIDATLHFGDQGKVWGENKI